VVSDAFGVFARRSSITLGSAWSFAGAVLAILTWFLSGPMFHFRYLAVGDKYCHDNRHLLMVFPIRHTQNRDVKAMHLKLDELIPRPQNARNELVDLENLSDEALQKMGEQFKRMGK